VKKVIATAIVLSFMLTLLGLSNAQAATTTTSLHTSIPGVVAPKALTVYCWLPHDIELTNSDATWCISGSGSVNIYNVTKAVDVDSHNISIDTASQDIPINAGKTVTFSGIHVIYVNVG